MDQKFVAAVNCVRICEDPAYSKALHKKYLFPLGRDIGFLSSDVDLAVKFRHGIQGIIMCESVALSKYKDFYCLRLPVDVFSLLTEQAANHEFAFVTIEGTTHKATAIITMFPHDSNILAEIDAEHESVSFTAQDLPPLDITPIIGGDCTSAIYSSLARRDPDLYSVRASQFLKTPHILTYLFSHVMALESRDHINYISTLKVISDNLRKLLQPRIRRIERDHHGLWGRFYGESVSFVDGGMSRIVSLPGTEPMGIRVGIYTVIPGEADLDKREKWHLDSYVIGDVLSDKSLIEHDIYQTDVKRLQEAARYILEPLSALRHVHSIDSAPSAVFLHGPLQNAFQTYDELEPYYIPGVREGFLSEHGISSEDIEDAIEHLPTNAQGRLLRNSCIPVYLYLMKQIAASDIPFVGVVERAGSSSFTRRVLNVLVQDNVIPDSTRRRLWETIARYEMGDELIFGCILEEGEYVEPSAFKKNLERRAHDRWQPVVAQFPVPFATMLKCSANNFPYRVEISRRLSDENQRDIMSLLYHTSLLLPNYAFPVGIDIADKYAKIPDWLSQGVSARLTANVLSKVLRTGDDRLLRQVRQLLALSPRDFFFRPKA